MNILAIILLVKPWKLKPQESKDRIRTRCISILRAWSDSMQDIDNDFSLSPDLRKEYQFITNWYRKVPTIIAVSYLYSLYLLPRLLGRPPNLASARLPIQALTARDTVPTVDSVKIAGNHFLTGIGPPETSSLSVASFPFFPARSFPARAFPARALPELSQLSQPSQKSQHSRQCGDCGISFPATTMFDAPDIVVIVLNFVLNLPSNLDLPGGVTIAVYRFLLLRRDMLDALDVGSFVLFLLRMIPHNVIRAVSRYRLATISPSVWNAEIDRGRCRADLRLPGQVLIDGVPSNLAAWTPNGKKLFTNCCKNGAISFTDPDAHIPDPPPLLRRLFAERQKVFEIICGCSPLHPALLSRPTASE
ncbi:hypothetical protein V8E54_008144 [Elaphomyces granulatus]